MKKYLLVLLIVPNLFSAADYLDNHLTLGAYIHAVGEESESGNYFGTVPKELFPKINEARAFMGKPRYTWEDFTTNPIVNREYMGHYLQYLYSQLKDSLTTEPNMEDIFFAYALGFEEYKKAEFNQENVKNKDVQMRFKWFQKFIEKPELVSEPPPPLNVPREVLGVGDGIRRVPTRTREQRQQR